MQQLLEAGADPRERNKNKDRPQEVIVNAGSEAGQRLRSMLREAEGRIALGGADVAGECCLSARQGSAADQAIGDQMTAMMNRWHDFEAWQIQRVDIAWRKALREG